MFRRMSLAAIGSLALLLGLTQAALASTTVEITGSFVESLGTRSMEGHDDHHFLSWSGIGAPSFPAGCPDYGINCGRIGSIDGYGRGRDEFFFEDEQLFYRVILEDGSSLLMALEFSDASAPGMAGEAPGAEHAYGNPSTLTFNATVVEGSGQFEGATGDGTATLHFAGAIDQIDFTLTLELP